MTTAVDPWDLTGQTSAQLFQGTPLPPKTPDLPTEPGLYVVDQPTHHDDPRWWVNSAKFELIDGYWTVDGRPRTIDEVNTITGGRPLVELVPTTGTDQ